MATLFRVMRKDAFDGRPAESSESGSGLGVRVPWDIEPDEEGIVHPDGRGMSVRTAPRYFERHRRPPAFGGTGKHPLWSIESEDLPEYLTYRPDLGDNPRHGVIEPSYSMDLEAFRDALASTRDDWRECP